jgi:hypothetical protein
MNEALSYQRSATNQWAGVLMAESWQRIVVATSHITEVEHA